MDQSNVETADELSHVDALWDGDPQPSAEELGATEHDVHETSSLSDLSSTPSRILSVSEVRPRGIFTDSVPETASFWVEINPKPGLDRNDYEADDDEFNVVGIIGELGEGDNVEYEVQFEDDHTALLPIQKLLMYPFAQRAWSEYQNYSSRRKSSRATQQRAYKEPSSPSTDGNLDLDNNDGDDDDTDSPRSKRRRTLARLYTKINSSSSYKRPLRSNRSGRLLYREDESDVSFSESSATRRSGRQRKQMSSLRYEYSDITDESSDSEEEPSRTASRSSARPKRKPAKEVFPSEDGTEFAKRHQYWCMLSSDFEAIEEGEERAYVQCQGCSFMYHVECLGSKTDRNNRHNIIVVRETEEETTCVLQCGRCKGLGKNGAVTMRCFVCAQVGDRCGDFVHPKIGVSEDSPLEGWNDASKVLFRCMTCSRACHFNHLPPPPPPKQSQDSDEMQVDIDSLEVYTAPYWHCNECREFNGKKVEIVLGWRTTLDSTSTAPSDLPDFTCEYLIKFEAESYARALWVPATWLAGVAFQIKSNFDAKSHEAIESSADVILDAWLRADIVFDVVYEDGLQRERMAFRSMEDEMEAASQVTSALCKWQKLTYEKSTWETPPKEDSPYWPDFKAAYDEYVRGNWIHMPNYRRTKIPYANTSKSEDVIQAEFGHRLEKKEQPEYIEGGKMFEYQLEGMNWLYFQWFKQTSCILADEMGLGKTIQIIAMIAVIFNEHQRWPYIIVAPNSTIENWRREFKKWAPSLRIVALPGTSEGRELVKNYELCRPKHLLDLKAHVVIAGYGTARTSVSFLRKYHWECLIVDEGQALKNDKSELFEELCTLKVQHRVILTGTPLQNNIRELFNIMQFLDPSQFKAEELESKYEELDEERVREIHAMLRPRFLRRVKADVMTSLPPKSEIIVPVSMSSVQKELYKSIISQNPELLKAITKRAEKGESATKSAQPKLANIVMQLRKCLAHPFVQAPALEDRTVGPEAEMRALVEGSGKLNFLAKILPKLKERGSRVLIFSQFLDMLDILEDFLTGCGMTFGRLDGSTPTVERQHMIDEFNSTESTLDCFLLSTRAGGAGINLATADTVIIYDPDFNPHQDMQALARAHRIGQEKKVLVFRLMTRNTVEGPHEENRRLMAEKIYQTAKKKMVLDHLIVESLDNNEEKLDVQALLLHGLKALFEDTEEKDIKYDDNDIEKLLDRGQIEETVDQQPASEEGGLGSFKTARIWANSTAQLEDLVEEEDNGMLEVGYWDQIIRERMSLAAAQKAAAQEEVGRGKRRATKKVDYTVFDGPRTDDIQPSSESGDEEFQAAIENESNDSVEQDEMLIHHEVQFLQDTVMRRSSSYAMLDNSENLQKASRPAFSGTLTQTAVQNGSRFSPNAPQNLSIPPSMNIVPDMPGRLPIKPQHWAHYPGVDPSRKHTDSNGTMRVPAPSSWPSAGLPIPPQHTQRTQGLPEWPLRPKTPPSKSGRNKMLGSHRSPSQPQLIPASTLAEKPYERIYVDLPSPDEKSVCIACGTNHLRGRCPLRFGTLMECPGCRYVHFHGIRTCPLFREKEYLDLLLNRLKESTEHKPLVESARAYVRGIRGNYARNQKKATSAIPDN